MGMREVMCLKFDSFVIILNHEQLASTKVFILLLFFFISRTIMIHVGLKKYEFR